MNMSVCNSVECILTQAEKQYPLKRQSTISYNSGDRYDIVSPTPTSTYSGMVAQTPTWTKNSSTPQPIASTNIDMTLATSYKPVLVCIAKVSALMVFHYASVPMLFVTERYALIVAVLYIDKWIASEYIVNTNSCAAILAVSLLVHELRDSGVQERIHGELAHNIVLSMLVISNIIVLVVAEQETILHLLFPSTKTSGLSTPLFSEELCDVNNKRYRQQLYTKNSTHFSLGTFMCVVGTSILLVVLSTCALPVSAHDPTLNNMRVWSFTILSLTWMYTINYKNLRYSIVSPFTPCLLRFSCILFLTPTPIALAGIVLITICLAITHMWLNNNQYSPNDTVSADHVYQSHSGDSVAVVVKDIKQNSSTGSVISYRAPCVIQEKTESLSVSAKSTNLNHTQNLTRGTTDNATIPFEQREDRVKETNPNVISDSSIDYTSMFLQAMSDRVDEESIERTV